MKRIILAFALVLAVTTTFGQDKWQQKQINYFVDSAVKEFGFSEVQKKELIEIRTAVVMSYVNSAQKVKDGEMNDDEKKEFTQKASKDFNIAFTKMTGKSYQELQPFLQRMQEDLKKK